MLNYIKQTLQTAHNKVKDILRCIISKPIGYHVKRIHGGYTVVDIVCEKTCQGVYTLVALIEEDGCSHIIGEPSKNEKEILAQGIAYIMQYDGVITLKGEET